MLGQDYKEKKCGSFGDISIFSFYPNKHITTGEGGMVLTDDEILWRSLTYGIFPFTHTHQASGASGVIYRVNNSANRKGVTPN